jgi:hypothetical protein
VAESKPTFYRALARGRLNWHWLPALVVMVVAGLSAHRAIFVLSALGAGAGVVAVGNILGLRTGLRVTSSGVQVVSYLATRRVPWRDIRAFRVIGQYGFFYLRVELCTGETVVVRGVNARTEGALSAIVEALTLQLNSAGR